MQALQHGAASYVPKRSLAHDLVSTVQTVLELHRARRASQRVLESLDRIESRFVLDNDVVAIPAIVGHLEADLTRLKLCDETALIQVGVALREALVNAIVSRQPRALARAPRDRRRPALSGARRAPASSEARTSRRVTVTARLRRGPR